MNALSDAVGALAPEIEHEGWPIYSDCEAAWAGYPDKPAPVDPETVAALTTRFAAFAQP